MICSQCGANNSDEAIFCQKCGKRLETRGQNESTLLSPPPISPYENFPYAAPGLSEPNYPPPPPGIPYEYTSTPYEPKPPLRPHSYRRYLIVIAVLVMILLSAGFFELGQLLKGNAQGNTTTVTPTAIPSSTPSLQGNVLYQEDGSDNWKGWKLASDWKIVDNGMLIRSDGSVGSNQAGPSAIPPFSLPKGVQDFAIETTIAAPQPQNWTHFSIIACGSMTNNSWQGYEGDIARDLGADFALIYVGPTQLVRTQFDPGTASHTYRLEIKKNVITLFVDHTLVTQAIDYASLPCGAQVGLVSSAAVILVSSFKVIAL
jgi:hypothetical protein